MEEDTGPKTVRGGNGENVIDGATGKTLIRVDVINPERQGYKIRQVEKSSGIRLSVAGDPGKTDVTWKLKLKNTR